MTKRMKSFISVFLVFLIIAGTSTVNVFSAYETVERYGTNYDYAGEFGLGGQVVKEVEWGDEVSDYNVYYSFFAEHDGYYSFRHNEMWNATEYCVCDKQYYEISYTYSMDDSEQNLSKIYYLEAGEYFFFVDLHWSMEDVGITAEYWGEKVSEIKFKHDLLLNCDCYYYGSSYSETNFVIDANATIIFDSGKTFDFGNNEKYDGYNHSDSLYAVIESEPVEGENRITIFFLNQQMETTVTIHTPEYYVKDVEVSNIDYYLETAVQYYNYYDMEYPYGETVTVTFNDGTSDSIVLSKYVNQNYVTFPNEQKYAVYFGCYEIYELDGFNGYLYVDILYDTVKAFKLNGSKASFSENLRVFNEKNKYLTDNLSDCWEGVVSSWNNTEDLSLYLSEAISCFIDISNNMFDFLGYYLTFSFLK